MPDHAPRRVRPARDKKARGTRKSRRRQTERRHAQDRSSLFQFDKRADEILGMQEDHGLAMRADARLARSGNRGALRPHLVPSSVNVFDFIADVVHAAIRILLEEIRDRRIVAQRLEQFDLRVAEIDEYRRHTVIGLRHFLRDISAQRVAVDLRSLLDVIGRNGDVIEPAYHECSFDCIWVYLASNLDDFHPRHRLLAPGVFRRPAHRPTHTLFQLREVRTLGIVTLDRFVECRSDGAMNWLRDAFEDNGWICGQPTLAVHDQRDCDHPGETEGPALARQADALLDQHAAVHVDAARRNLVDHARAARRQAYELAVRGHDGLGHLQRTRQTGMFGLVTRLAVHRHGNLRSGPAIHLSQLVATGVSRNMYEMVFGRQQLDAERR